MTARRQSMSLFLFICVLLLTCGCSYSEEGAPEQEATVPLPLAGVQARIEVFASSESEGRFELVVNTPAGVARSHLWGDWGPAQRVSMYVTPDHRIIALGGPRVAEMIAIPPNDRPYWIPYAQRQTEDGSDWTYVGAVDRRGSSLYYYAPDEQRECVPFYAGEAKTYRRQYTVDGSC